MSENSLTWHTTNSRKTPEWRVDKLEHGDRGVIKTVHWTCRITRWGTEDNDFVATSGQTTLEKTTPDAEGFVEFDDLTETQVLEWVRDVMLDKWNETENDIVDAWEKSRWAKSHKEEKLPWSGVMVLRSTEEEEEPTWVKSALEVDGLSTVEEDEVHSERNAGIEEEPPEQTAFEPLDMPEDDTPITANTSMFGTNSPQQDARDAAKEEE